MKIFIKILLLLLLPWIIKAQTAKQYPDSLHKALESAADDTMRMVIYDNLGWYYQQVSYDSILNYAELELQLARELHQNLDASEALFMMGSAYENSGNYPKSLQSFMLALAIAQDPESEKNCRRLPSYLGGIPRNYRLGLLRGIYLNMGLLYGATGNLSKEVSIFLEARDIANSFHDSTFLAIMDTYLGGIYLNLGRLDSALLLELKAISVFSYYGFNEYKGLALNYLGDIYLKKGNLTLSRDAIFQSIGSNEEQNDIRDLGHSFISAGKLYATLKKPDSSLFYAQKGLQTYMRLGDAAGMATGDSLLSSIYNAEKRTDSAFFYLESASSIKDSLGTAEQKILSDFQNIGFDEQMRLKELEEEKIQTQTKIRTYAMLAALAVFMLIGILLYRNNRNRKKANELLQKQKEEIGEQKKNVEHALSELKSTQAQLVQSEKMASLGELTAGIAHEIQNPLNFMNNFSEVNVELIDELKQELKSGNLADADSIAENIRGNEEKINHHGKRADAIVKGMLQHSRSSTGIKEPTDINALADEYLRLSYHGLRAKDNSFNASMKTDFDLSIGNVNIIPQDIGRVFLNLYNNAFYAVGEKKKQQPDNYEPTVAVGTKKSGNQVVISIKDNGNGIPQRIVDKIFQPFFTTKPTGQGTGLGLSLSYDIIKAHNGEIKVETKEGEGTTFIIQLALT